LLSTTVAQGVSGSGSPSHVDVSTTAAVGAAVGARERQLLQATGHWSVKCEIAHSTALVLSVTVAHGFSGSGRPLHVARGGLWLGDAVTDAVEGDTVGPTVGELVGELVVGDTVGSAVGEMVGELVEGDNGSQSASETPVGSPREVVTAVLTPQSQGTRVKGLLWRYLED